MPTLLAALIALALVAPADAASRRKVPACRQVPAMACYPNPDPGAGLGTFICAPRRAPAAKAPTP